MAVSLPLSSHAKPLDQFLQAAELARELKRLCGSGGSVVDGVIEIQGDHRAKVIAHLEAGGLQVKSAGG